MVIKKAVFYKSFLDLKDLPTLDLKEIGLLGRSNVGKSSFINAITNNYKLARTSKTPGKTITINFYLINDDFFLVDLPGYGYASRELNVEYNFSEKTDKYISLSKNLKGFILIVDSRTLTKDDTLMNDYLMERGAKYLVLLSKIDKLKRNDIKKRIDFVSKELSVDKNNIVAYSAYTHENENILLEKLEELIKN